MRRGEACSARPHEGVCSPRFVANMLMMGMISPSFSEIQRICYDIQQRAEDLEFSACFPMPLKRRDTPYKS